MDLHTEVKDCTGNEQNKTIRNYDESTTKNGVRLELIPGYTSLPQGRHATQNIEPMGTGQDYGRQKDGTEEDIGQEIKMGIQKRQWQRKKNTKYCSNTIQEKKVIKTADSYRKKDELILMTSMQTQDWTRLPQENMI